jgi:hypothetical protein
MTKRVAASVLWFVSVGWGMNFVGALLGVPQLPGLLLAAGVAALVGIDPLHLFWPVREPQARASGFEKAPPQGALAAR